MVEKAFVQGCKQGFKINIIMGILKNGMQPVNLFLVIGKNAGLIAVCSSFFQVVSQEFEIFLKGGLGPGVEFQVQISRKQSLLSLFNHRH